MLVNNSYEDIKQILHGPEGHMTDYWLARQVLYEWNWNWGPHNIYSFFGGGDQTVH